MPKPKVKSAKATDDESKKLKGKKSGSSTEELDQTQTKEEQSNMGQSTTETVINSTIEIKEPVVVVEEVAEVKYEEPVLTYIIVESYEGEKEKGLFQGVGKALFKGGNVYEGEFQLGVMTGKGKYTWANGITYEGDFLNNEINGQGVFKWPNPNDPNGYLAIYEGQVCKGKRHGSGIFRSGTTPVAYFGDWQMGKRYGKGKMIYNVDGTSFYEGDWVNNRKFGWGIRHYSSGNIYEGMWVNDIRHGEGTMKWFDKNQIYTGQWENGVQNGLGEHNWYLARVEMTQYALRNTYYGMFVSGRRHGQGTFLYANGAKYEGGWESNLKHGWGKYTFKDGTVYEGYFEDDKMTNAPTYKRVSAISQEISKIKTRIPSAGTTLNIHKLSNNTEIGKIEFDLKLDLSSILVDFKTDEERNAESVQALKTIIRYLDLFKQIYRFYSQLGFDTSPDNTYVLNRMQFWRFLKDCKLHINDIHLTLMDFDRLLNPNMSPSDLHCPYDKILIRQFYNYIVLASYHLYKSKFEGTDFKISWCIEKIITDNFLPHACNVQGYFYADVRKTLTVLTHMVKSYDIYRFISSKRKKAPQDWSITLRKFITILNDFKLLDGKNLNSKMVTEVMSNDNPLVFDSDDAYNLELEITFLEFFEILIGCAIRYGKLPEEKKKPKSVKKVDEQVEEPSSVPQSTVEPTQNSTEQVVPSDNAATDENTNLNENSELIAAIRPLSATEVNVINEEEELKKREEEFNEWVEKNNFFFEKKFFPAADNYEMLTRLVNSSLDRD